MIQGTDNSAKTTYYEVMPVLYGIFGNSEFESLDVPAWCVPKLDELARIGYLASELYEDKHSENGFKTVYHIPRAFSWDLDCLCKALANMVPDTIEE